MKKIIYLCLITFLSISFGCSKDEVIVQEDSGIEQQDLLEKDSSPRDHTSDKQPVRSSDNPIPLPGSDVETYYLYLNLDLIEDEYNNNPNNPSYTGSFNIFYRNLMSTHYTIYHVLESTNDSCGNVERWIVNLDELNQYLLSIGLPEIDPNDGYDWYLYGDPGSVTSSSTMHHVDSTGTSNPRNTLPPPPPPLPEWLINYNHCFSL